jgi:hypothetical protein
MYYLVFSYVAKKYKISSINYLFREKRGTVLETRENEFSPVILIVSTINKYELNLLR